MAKVKTIEQAVGKKKASLIETALVYWAAHCAPNELEAQLLDELAFEENFKNLAQFIRAERGTKGGTEQ